MSDSETTTAKPFDFTARDRVGEPTFDVAGNKLRFVHHPEDRFDAVIRLIRSARESIRAFYYMVTDDESGTAVVNELCEAARRGIDVSFGIDSFGSADTDIEWFDRLKQCGVDFFCFSSRRSRRYLVRNHQKMLIIDGKVALIGGYNLRDSYFCRGSVRHWEDIGVILEGEHVTSLCEYYDEFKKIAADGKARLRDVRRLIQRWVADDGALEWAFGGPTVRLSSWALKLKHDLERAKRATIVSAYFSPGRAMLRRIAKVGKRGGALTLMLAGKSDSGVTIRASRLLYKYLTKRGADIYEYQKRCLHMKMLTIDDVVYVGSANMDPRSLFLNCEIMLRVESAEIADHMRGLVEEMKDEAEHQTLALIKKKQGPIDKAVSAACYLAVGVIDYSVTRTFGLPIRRKNISSSPHEKSP